ncbi:M1 family metallopeptidase [Lysobacter sp. A6]|uniref:M1 family metallopeptidase n=1 Tax=Noviluteimonas lactosilytica TaxID=2888523 RepID=A0ABS8JF66_9GAMM|nr:M1 family metallopeptidase [Lysobacter lactosilyticus]MCC8362239.1 M1 family metallopeptidase [Lysobacter lactosilyticus]
MTSKIRIQRWAVGLALASTCVLVATAQVKTAAPVTAPIADVVVDDSAVDDIGFAPANGTAVTVPSAENAWGGARTGTEATLSDRVVTYKIQATLDPKKHTIDGKQQLTWRNRSDRPVKAVYLHLYLNAFEGPGSTFNTEMRNNRFGFRSGVQVEEGGFGYSRLQRVAQNGAKVPWKYVQPDGGPSTDRTVVRLDLPEAVAPGGETTIDMDFFNQLPRVSARTGYYGTFHLVGQWFPKIGVLELPGERGATAPRWNVHEFHLHSEFFADYGLYDVSLTVPKDYTVGATGEEQGAPVEKNGMVTRRFVQGDVHDFAWTADNRYAKPLDGVYNGANGPVKVRVLYHPEYANNAEPVLKATIDSLTYFSKTLGDYPYKTVTAVVPPYNADEAGGMEYPTFFTASSYKDVREGRLERYLLDFVTIHEFGHGYFYGIIGSNEFEEPWLDEGLNEYWDHRQLVAAKQHATAQTAFTRLIGFDIGLGEFEQQRLGAMLSKPADPLGNTSWDRMSSGSYGTVYSRTATMMHDIEQQVGKDALERAFKLYYARWKFRHPSSADFREALAEGTGQRALIEKTFAEQVYGTRKVDDSIAEFSSDEILPQPGIVEYKGKPVEITQEQIDKAVDGVREKWKKAHPKAKENEGAASMGAFPYATRIVVRRDGAVVANTVLVRFEDGTSRTLRMSDTGDKRWARWRLVTRSKAVSVELDPERRVFLDRDKIDDSRTLEADGSASRRWSADLAALFQSFLALLVSV